MDSPKGWQSIVEHGTGLVPGKLELEQHECQAVVAFVKQRVVTAAEKGYAEGKDALSEALHATPRHEAQERREFIRQHASRLEAAYLLGQLSAGRMPTMGDPVDTWKIASGLWAAKPEDC